VALGAEGDDGDWVIVADLGRIIGVPAQVLLFVKVAIDKATVELRPELLVDAVADREHSVMPGLSLIGPHAGAAAIGVGKAEIVHPALTPRRVRTLLPRQLRPKLLDIVRRKNAEPV